MIISQTENQLFFSLYFPLLYYTNRCFNIHKKIKKLEDLLKIDVNVLADIRDKLYENLELFDNIQSDNSKRYNEIEKAILNSWKTKHIKDTFIIFKHLKKHSIFIPVGKLKLYGVYGLTDELKENFPPEDLPMIVETVLLPFNDKIIYDGLVSINRIIIGKNLYEDLKEKYKNKKETEGIIEKL